MIKQLTILGLGLLGSSVARAAKEKGICDKIIAYDTHLATLEKAEQLGIIDAYQTKINMAVQSANMVLIAVPLSQYEKVFKQLNNTIGQDTIITDVGSTKDFVMQNATKFLPKHVNNFVSGHPIAGSDRSGVEAGKADLFKNKWVLLTPNANTNVTAIKTVKQFWQYLGAQVECLSAELHDKILATISHLPHVIAYAFMHSMVQKKNHEKMLNYVGNGFKDFTRIAASNPTIWHDICMANSENIISDLECFQSSLEKLKKTIVEKNSTAMLEIFKQSKIARDKL